MTDECKVHLRIWVGSVTVDFFSNIASGNIDATRAMKNEDFFWKSIPM